jgi:hypothetical protein
MLPTMMLILVAMVALASFEIWLFWWLGDHDDRRHAGPVRDGSTVAG